MFKIGEFSKIAQVSVHLLRHYDEIDLLKPATTDEWTNYRFYSAKQLPRLNRILVLKEMGLSLQQIKTIVDQETSAEEVRGMFALKKAQLEQSIQDDINLLRTIEARLKRIDEGDRGIDFDIVVTSVPRHSVLTFRNTFHDFSVVQHMMVEMVSAVHKANMGNVVGEMIAVLHDDALQEKDHDIEIGFFTSEPVDPVQLSHGRWLEPTHLPAVEKMATAIKVGLPTTSHVCRADLALWIEENGYELAGTGREIFKVPPRPGKEDETVMEIQFPIRLTAE